MSTIRANPEPRWSVICACFGLLAVLPTLLYILSLLPFHVAGFASRPSFSGERAAYFVGALLVIGAFCYFATFYFARLARRHAPLLRTSWTLSAVAHLTLAIMCGAGAYHTITRMGGTNVPFNFALALLCTAFASVAFLGSTYAALTVFHQRA
jgi:hypothetical protein